ncbi:hypothetical protein [Thermococcus gorgonarius]|uniref:Uncharacterized protein n=1 Tax=Thermococcus gorgonarius TaxID=71997 RepID=A0A2Z2M7L0_THEGO|nr:hypothetical protein [Thermococcus gorgonarius]ASJ00385.1 hypothetical protein A3K92_02245 [Thermococcus gorgonarius]
MDARDIVELIYQRNLVSRETWKAVSVKKNGDGTVDILYKNLHVGSDDDPVFLWVYANVVDEDGPDVRILEKITFKKEDLVWILRYIPKRGEGL